MPACAAHRPGPRPGTSRGALYGDTPLRAEQVTDPYRRGMILTACPTSRADRAWLQEVLDGDGIRGADEESGPQTHTRDRKD